MNDDVLSLPFDQYQRYRLVADLIGRVRAEGAPLRVLDVGGRTEILRSFLPDDRIDLVDVEASEAQGLVLGDGSRLPFRDGSFDVVAAFDTLEHIPPAARDAFVDECARVSRGWVLIAGPYKSPEVDEAEELLQGFLETKLRLKHRYLEEHRENGLPVRADTEARLERAGAQVASHGHANLDRWVVLMCMEMYMDHDPGLRPIAARFFRFYNERLYASDHAAPVYRHVVTAAMPGRSLPDVSGLLGEPVAPPEALPPVRRLAEDLLAFDREKDVWEPEFERLKGELAKLEADLAGHKERLEEREADLVEHRASLTELNEIHARALAEHAEEKRVLEADLEEHGRSLAEVRGTLERTQAEALEEKRSLEADLESHARALEDTRAAQEEERAAARAVEGELRSQVAALEEAVRGLEAHLAETEEGARGIQSELVAAQGEIVRLVGQVAERDAELRHRLRNLRRAFAVKKWGD